MADIEGPRPQGTPCWNDQASPDVSTSATFYGRVFGWQYDASGPEYGHYHLARDAKGRATAGLGQMQDGTQMPPAWTVYFAADDVDAMCEHAATLGGNVLMGPMDIPGQGRMAIVQDPTGAVFGLWQSGGHKGAEVEGEPGAMAWREVITGDVEAARDFYTKLLGATSRALEGTGTTYYALVKDGQDIAGVMQMEARMQGTPPHWLAYFEVDEVSAAEAAATAAGGKVIQPGFDTPFGRIAVLSDPAGAIFAVHRQPG